LYRIVSYRVICIVLVSNFRYVIGIDVEKLTAAAGFRLTRCLLLYYATCENGAR